MTEQEDRAARLARLGINLAIAGALAGEYRHGYADAVDLWLRWERSNAPT